MERVSVHYGEPERWPKSNSNWNETSKVEHLPAAPTVAGIVKCKANRQADHSSPTAAGRSRVLMVITPASVRLDCGDCSHWMNICSCSLLLTGQHRFRLAFICIPLSVSGHFSWLLFYSFVFRANPSTNYDRWSVQFGSGFVFATQGPDNEYRRTKRKRQLSSLVVELFFCTLFLSLLTHRQWWWLPETSLNTLITHWILSALLPTIFAPILL